MADTGQRVLLERPSATLQPLLIASTKTRVQRLQDLSQEIKSLERGEDGRSIPWHISELLLTSRADGPGRNALKILTELYLTYPLYQDRPSRRAVQSCFLAALNNEIIAAATFFDLSQFLRQESRKKVIAPTNAFVLLEWCALLQEQGPRIYRGNQGSRTEKVKVGPELCHAFNVSAIVLAEAAARLLAKCFEVGVRRRIKHSAKTVARRGIRTSFSSEGDDQTLAIYVIFLTSFKDYDPCMEYAPYIGLIAEVASETPVHKEQMSTFKDQVLDFYVKTEVGSKTLVPSHVADGLYGFFSEYVTTEDLNRAITPHIARGIMRSPEVLLHEIIPALANCSFAKPQFGDSVTIPLVKPLISSFTSSSAKIRDGAVDALKALLKKTEGPALNTIADRLLAELKTSKFIDHRVVLLRGLQGIPPTQTVSTIIVNGIIPLAAKESNESTLTESTLAITRHMSLLLCENIEVPKTVSDTVIKGCSDKRPALRKVWLLKLADMLYNLHTAPKRDDVVQFVNSLVAEIQTAYDEISKNAVPAVQTGNVAIGYLLVALAKTPLAGFDFSKIKADVILDHALQLDPKPSFVLNAKVYTRLTTAEDTRWAALALISASEKLGEADEDVRIAWAQAMLYILTSPSVTANARKEAGSWMFEVYSRSPGPVSESIISGIWQWVRDFATDDKDSAAILSKAGVRSLHTVLALINPSADVRQGQTGEVAGGLTDLGIIKQQAVSTLVLSRPELVPRMHWIENCLRQGIDPGTLASERSKALMIEVLQRFELGDTLRVESIKQAACDAAAELAFVGPDSIIPLVVECLRRDLDPVNVAELGQTEAAIARMPEGVAYVDVLSQKTNGHVESKNRKDYDIEKWEEELRVQVAQKKGEQRKLKPDEQAKVDAQLAKEAIIRQNVNETTSHLCRGAGLVRSLAKGPPTDARLWIVEGVSLLIAAFEAGGALFAEAEMFRAYIACADKVTPRLGTLREFIGIATLRAAGYFQLPKQLEAEPLGELVTRVLYRLRFTAEQRPYDTVSFAYTLPLIFVVLDKGCVGGFPGEDADAQVLLALEFLSFQMESCSDTYLPRTRILQTLVMSMQTYGQHYRLLKDAFLLCCRSIAATIDANELQTVLSSIVAPESSVRGAVLQAINEELDITDLGFSKEVWLACHDEEEENVETAVAIWEESAFSVQKDNVAEMLPYFRSPHRAIRVAAARALAQSVEAQPETFAETLTYLQDTYVKDAQPVVPKRDKYGMVQKGDTSDPWQSRSGIALALKAMVPVFETQSFVPFTQFLISSGPLADRNATVRDEMVEAGTLLVAERGEEGLEPLMSLFEKTLEAPDKGTKESDWTNEAVIVLYGSVARHLQVGEARVKTVITKLLATLSTPSEPVQYAVASCLPPLIRLVDSDLGSYVAQLLKQLFEDRQFAARRGAAFGLAGLVKGKGLGALREFRIISSLRAAADNKKDPKHRQGAMFAYELFAIILGRIFEPYMIEVLPQLLACFGDPDTSVRDACLDTSKACFASLSSYGVSKVLPQLLEGLDDSQWRSQRGACDLLGAMAYLDPQQLANSLPEIIPPLTAIIGHTHKEVRASAKRSLQRFGEVITNPEVKSLVDVLLKALSDPTKYTEDALDGLSKVSFIHYLDAPSLALVVRILERGLKEGSSTKRKSAQIIGNLAHLTERKDILTHLPILVSGLRAAAVDPVPTTRATASKALGSLVEKLGEDALPDLIPSLMSSLRTDTGAGDRLGSAQALSEVLAGLGTTRLEETLPTILQNVQSTKPAVREGFMTLFIFLPACFGNSFANYLKEIIPSILGGLADDLEAIRDTALRAGRLLVKNFATKAIDLLLPELQRGLADDSYRIRLSSVELVGDLLFNLTGISSKNEAGEEDESAQQAGQSLLEVLGEDRRNKVLSSLYICRCDTSGLVRNEAIAVWKALVATPRTLRELVPTLTQMIISRLASSNMEHVVIAGNALGEVIRKAGDGVLYVLLPSLQDGLQSSTDVDNRQGICIALKEVVTAASPEAVEENEKKLIAIVRIALIDSDPDVREAAAEAFDSLQQVFGKRAVDQVLPHLLNQLRNEDEAENALSGLLTLLTETTRANVIIPTLLPTLLASPTVFNARALASLAKVGGSAMNRRLPMILNTLAQHICSPKIGKAVTEELNIAFETILASVDEFDGLNTAMSVMLALMKHEDEKKRAMAAQQLATFFSAQTVDYSRYNQDLVRVLLISFDDFDKEVLKAAWEALSQLVGHMRKEEMESLTTSTRQVLQQVGVAGSPLPGFALPKGIQPVMQIFLQGLMNGGQVQRVAAAHGLADIIERTEPDSLKVFVTQITGPLIRFAVDRAVEVKCAILYTLDLLLGKIPASLRPFLPQLSRTFTKAMADPSSDVVRNRGTKALTTFIPLTPRVDPLVAELVTGAKISDAGVRNTMLKGLQEVVSQVGGNMSEASRDSVLELMDSSRDVSEEIGARLLGAMIKVLDHNQAAPLIKTRVLISPPTNASILAINACLAESPDPLTTTYLPETRNVIMQGISNKHTSIQHGSVLAGGKLLLSADMSTGTSTHSAILSALAAAIPPGADIDTRRLGLVVLRTVTRTNPNSTRPSLAALAPAVFAAVRDSVIPVKLAAEAAFLELFAVVDEDAAVFDAYMAGPAGQDLPVGTQRAMGDYFRRVAMRLAGQARERREAEGGAGGLGLAGDEAEDEREVWSVGRVDVQAANGFE